MRITSLSTRRKAVAALSVAAVVGFAGVATAPMASAASVAATLSAVSGPSGGLNALTATTATNAFTSGFNAGFYVKTTATTACAPAYVAPGTNLNTTSPKLLSAKKIALTVPSGVILAVTTPVSTSTAYLLCVYPGTNATTSLLQSSATYTVASAPTVTGISTSGGTPATTASGPALGGGTLTITGTGFTGTATASTTTAKIGSVALTGVTWVSATTLTGVIPPQAAAAGLAVSVTNTGGTASLASAFSYTNGINVSPATTTSSAAVDVDIQGVGFSSLTLTHTTGATIDDATAHVYITNGDYDATGGTKAHSEVGECLNVLVISDNELICTIDPTHPDGTTTAPLGNGTYTITTVSDGTPGTHVVGTAGYQESILTSGSTFTVAPY
jgi:hypothetical protein